MELKIRVPEKWNVINKKDYKRYSIISNEDCPCEVGYRIENTAGGEDVVSIFRYKGADATFLNELKLNLDRLAKNSSDVSDINEYLAEKTDGYDVQEAESLFPLYYKQGTLFGMKSFVNIMKIKTNIGTAYSLQIFIPVQKDIICFSTSSTLVNESDPFNSFMSRNKYVSDLVNVMIKSLA